LNLSAEFCGGLQLRGDGLYTTSEPVGVRAAEVEMAVNEKGDHVTLGSGAEGIVLRGHVTQTKEPVSVKIVRSSSRREILNEIRAMMTVTSPHLVRLLGAYRVGPHVHLVREFFDIGSLADLSRNLEGLTPPEMVANFMTQIASGLESLHATNIVHRDMKPSNMLIKTNGTVKVADFGVARSVDSRKASEGTTAYMSPERLGSEDCSFAADVWALGLTAFELVTGNTPHKQECITDLWEFHNGPLPRLAGDSPRGLQLLVERTLQRNPADRFSATQIKEIQHDQIATAEEVKIWLLRLCDSGVRPWTV
jgi:serine/threonine protein kinase